MEVVQMDFRVSTRDRNEMVDITQQVGSAVKESGISDGIATVYCPHTTAAITINENADRSVMHDILLTLNELIPHNRPGYRHVEGNSDSHCKSSLIGCSRDVMIANGSLCLGTWQGLFFCEFDGPRNRKVLVQVRGR